MFAVVTVARAGGPAAANASRAAAVRMTRFDIRLLLLSSWASVVRRPASGRRMAPDAARDCLGAVRRSLAPPALPCFFAAIWAIISGSRTGPGSLHLGVRIGLSR